MRLLIIRLSALGDIVHTWPLAEVIGHRRSDVHVTWAVDATFRPMVDGHPAVDEVLEVSTRTWRRRPLSGVARTAIADLRRRLRAGAYDFALDPQGLVKSALVARLSAAPRRVGLERPWRRELLAGLGYTETLPGAHGARHVVATNLELVRALGVEPPTATPAPDGRWLLSAGRATPIPGWSRTGFAAILAGAGGPGKILPAAILARVAAQLEAAGTPALVVWGPGEEARARELAAAAGGAAEIAPPTDLLQLAWLLSRARVVIGGDTGPVHLAASLGVPTVGCYLITDWRRNGPLGERVAVVSAAASNEAPASTARTRKVRDVEVDELVAAALRVLA